MVVVVGWSREIEANLQEGHDTDREKDNQAAQGTSANMSGGLISRAEHVANVEP